MRHPTAFLCALLFAITTVTAQDQPTSLLYSIANPTPGQRLLLQQHFDVLGNCCGGGPNATGPLEVVVQANAVNALLAIAPAARFVDFGRPFQQVEAERALAGGNDVPDPGYYTVAEIEAAIDAQVAAHPTIARKVNLSALPGGVFTHEGRPIYALKVSDNVATDEDEPAIVIAAQHHARELNSPVMVIGAMQRLLAGFGTNATLTSVVNGYEVYFVPMVNPDGVNHVWTVDDFWRKNRRNNGGGVFGVDLNRNYPFLWSLCGSSAVTTNETYRGPAAGSEPETAVMRNLVARLRPEVYLDFHSSGQQVLRLWAPCATVHPTMLAFQQRYCDDVRNPMTYGTRDPSGSGEAPEDHYSSGGTLSYLIEIGTSFQPPIATTNAEEVRVWPGVQRVLSTWRPARRGHVRSSLGNAPLEATITFAPNLMNHGEVTRSRSRDGRYGLWLPLGNWNVTFAAPGHVSQTIAVSVTSYDAPVTTDVVLVSTSCARYVPDAVLSGTINTIPFGTASPSSLPTLFASNNSGSAGGAVYFDLTPTTNLYLCGLDVNTAAGAATPLTVDVYTRSGTYAGNEGSNAGWTARTAGHGTAAGSNLPSSIQLDQMVPLAANTTYGIALVARDFGHLYTNGTGANQNYGDANLAVSLGAASNVPFSTPTFTPRVANLNIDYRTDTSAWTNQRYQTILRQGQLAGAGPITGLAFDASTTGRHWNRSLQVRMSHVAPGHTLSSTFATNLPAPITVLSTTNYTWHTQAGSWSELGLQTPFAYDGVSDVVIDILAVANHATVAGGFHRGNGDVPRVFDAGWAFGATPATGSLDDLGQRLRISFHCANGNEFGTACGALRADHVGTGARGTTFAYHVHDAPANGAAVVALGFNNGSPYPLSLTSSGFTNCYSWNDGVSTLFYVTDGTGFAQHAIALPASASFDGLKIFGQWFALDASQPGGLTASAYTRLILGVAP